MWYSSYYDYGSNHIVDDQKLRVGGWGDWYYTFIKFDLGCLPKQATNVWLSMMPYDPLDGSSMVDTHMYRVTDPWEETSGWSGTLNASYVITWTAPTAGNWWSPNITTLYNGWQSGAYPNYGLMFAPSANGNQFNNFRSSDYSSDVTQRPKLIIEYTPNTSEPFKPCFPLKENTPYKAAVTAVQDHSVPSGFYARDNVVQAYNGEAGSVTPYDHTSTVVGYKTPHFPFHFILPIISGYTDDGASTSGKDVLFYDGHSGYDYKAGWRDPILAATDGVLCISTSSTGASGQTPWRNTSKCPYGNDSAIVRGLDAGSPTSWARWHTFYIVHPGGTYSTWYLHANDLDASIWNAILLNGYADVTRLQTVGYVGNWGLVPIGSTSQVGKHLHFEVRNGMSTGNVLDPYGNGTIGSIVWGPRP
jgi:murein DD-endopeptidase MepM/ murein hydrolase activator NlpD